MMRKDNTKYLLQWIKVAVAFFVLLLAAFCFFQTMKEGPVIKAGMGNLRVFDGWEKKVEMALEGWKTLGSPKIGFTFLIAGMLLCGLLEICEEAGGSLFLLL